jgi:hypothetical protein
VDYSKPDDYSPPEHSIMASGDPLPASKDLSVTRESDTIHSLHEHGYTMPELHQLLMPEIDTLTEGAERAERRREKERDG